MWSIGEVKRSGWISVKRFFGAAILVSIFPGVITSLGSYASGALDRLMVILSEMEESGEGGLAAAGMILSLSFFTFLVTTAGKVFLLNPLEVGRNRFYLEGREKGSSPGFIRVFWAFSSGCYLNIVKILFLRDLFIALWTLLLIIPGIYKAYEYSQLSFILAENPDVSRRDAFLLTKDMMDGERFHLFGYEFSFLGWYLLGALACGVGILFVNPYHDSASAEVYTCLKNRINGFPFNGFGYAGTEADDAPHWEVDN